LGEIPSFSAISLMVNPSIIYFISVILTEKLKYFKFLPIISLTTF
jgi:hypothetical protein